MNGLDLALILALAVGAIYGLRMGSFRLVITLVGLYANLLLASYVRLPVGGLVGGLSPLSPSGGGDLISFLAPVIAIQAAVEWGSRLLFPVARWTLVRPVEKGLGMVLGLLVAALAATLLLSISASPDVAELIGTDLGIQLSEQSEGSLLLAPLQTFKDLVLATLDPLLPGGVPSFLRSL